MHLETLLCHMPAFSQQFPLQHGLKGTCQPKQTILWAQGENFFISEKKKKLKQFLPKKVYVILLQGNRANDLILLPCICCGFHKAQSNWNKILKAAKKLKNNF